MTEHRFVLAIFLVACGGASAPDGGIDAVVIGVDAGSDAGGDASNPAPDAGPLPACGTDSPLALSQCAEASRYQDDLVFVAMEREPSSAHWMAVQDLCAQRFADLGFTVERHAYATGVNVIGTRMGETDPTHRVLVGAHYDHIPGCPGADDNASGVAGLLETARVLSQRSYPRTLVVGCWDEEERGLIGSRAYAMRAHAGGETIDDYYNLEMIGFRSEVPDSQTIPPGLDLLFREQASEIQMNQRRGNFIAAVGNQASNRALLTLERYADRIGFAFIGLEVPPDIIDTIFAGDLRRSDHASFWDESYPAIMLTDTSEFRYPQYHCMEGDDVVANLDREFATEVVRITVASAAESLGLVP